jgi:hypothetical protein
MAAARASGAGVQLYPELTRLSYPHLACFNPRGRVISAPHCQNQGGITSITKHGVLLPGIQAAEARVKTEEWDGGVQSILEDL